MKCLFSLYLSFVLIFSGSMGFAQANYSDDPEIPRPSVTLKALSEAQENSVYQSPYESRPSDLSERDRSTYRMPGWGWVSTDEAEQDDFVGIRVSYSPEDQNFVTFVFQNTYEGPKFGVRECRWKKFEDHPDGELPECGPLLNDRLYDVEAFYVIMNNAEHFFAKSLLQSKLQNYIEETGEISYFFEQVFYNAAASAPFFYAAMKQFEKMPTRYIPGSIERREVPSKRRFFGKKTKTVKVPIADPSMRVDRVLEDRVFKWSKRFGWAAIIGGVVYTAAEYAKGQQYEAYKMDVSKGVFVESQFFEERGFLSKEEYLDIVNREGQTLAKARLELFEAIPDESEIPGVMSAQASKIKQGLAMKEKLGFKYFYREARADIARSMMESIAKALSSYQEYKDKHPDAIFNSEEMM
ncbi:MAG: hypothetical protein KDD50_04290 [Bdellovibrionales bacterium]|nr:hypothetical protein [Bdellovibrionales bacterium]